MTNDLFVIPYPFHIHRESVHRIHGSDKQDILIFAAKCNISGPFLVNFDLFASRVKHKNTFIGEVNIAPVVDGHPVEAHFAEEGTVG